MLSVSKLLSLKAGNAQSDAERARYSRQGPPVVVWNITRRCDLHCVHCYNDSAMKDYPGELSTAEAKGVIDGLSAFRVPALIFSGGDPLLREDFFELASYSRQRGIRPILSTSGVNIDDAVASRVRESGVVYAGVSLDGGEETNDRLRGAGGAYKRALQGLRLLKAHGIVTGIRFTMSKKTVGELPHIFDLLEDEGIDRGYFAHLVYSGRGERFSREDLDHGQTRDAVDYIFDRAEDFITRGLGKDIVTGSNDVDGVYLYLRLAQSGPDRAGRVHEMLCLRGGNSSGVTLANIDNLGFVHPDQFWRHPLGNVRERPFGEIWTDTTEPVMKALKQRRDFIKGRCAACPHFDICGGNYRVRAEFTTGDMWAEDPACYLADAELGIETSEKVRLRR